MSVHDGANVLARSVESILRQEGVALELILVNDGSTDDSGALIDDFAARDDRVLPIHQQHRGLTAALRLGCRRARGRYIARHDSGDVSTPDRFARQRERLDGDDSIVLVSCATEWIGPAGEPLYVAIAEGDEVRGSLLGDPVSSIRGLSHHGSAMFRRDAYLASGGYRSEFYFAQDLDLWIRLAAFGRVAFVPDVLYRATLDVGAISSRHRREQIESARLAIAIRDEPSDERRRELLARAAAIRPAAGPRSRRDEARALYFIASCLRRNGDARWRSYAREALQRRPWSPRTWSLLLRGGP